MTPHPRLLAATSVCALLVGCSGGGQAVPAQTAERLAGQADEIASLAQSGDGCAARERAGALVQSTQQARAAGELSEPVAGEITATAQTIAESVSCEPPPADGPPPEDEGGGEPGTGNDDDRGRGETDRDEGRGNGQGRGNGGDRGEDEDDREDD